MTHQAEPECIKLRQRSALTRRFYVARVYSPFPYCISGPARCLLATQCVEGSRRGRRQDKFPRRRDTHFLRRHLQIVSNSRHNCYRNDAAPV